MVGRKILFRFEAYPELGMGHAFRSMGLMKQLCRHECMAVISEKSALARDILRRENVSFMVAESDEDLFGIIRSAGYGIVVNDILDTEKEYVEGLKALGCRVINLEDEGSGSRYADAVVNELYEDENERQNQYYGYRYYCLPESMGCLGKNPFREEARELLVLFGCTDPACLSEKTINALDSIDGICNVHVTVAIGPGNKRLKDIGAAAGRSRHRENIELVSNADLKGLMQKADIAVCSQGRTMFELAHLAVPAVIMAQNERERRHTFASLKNGFVNLGLGREVPESGIINAVELLLRTSNIRRELHASMMNLHLEEGNKRVIKIILGERPGC